MGRCFYQLSHLARAVEPFKKPQFFMCRSHNHSEREMVLAATVSEKTG